MVLVDTSVWSLAFRREAAGEPHPAVDLLKHLIETDQPICMLGIILMEVLQGVKSRKQFLRLRSALRPFPLLELRRRDYEAAAELQNHCRSLGIAASTIDFLIAAASIQHRCALLTTDRDFEHISRASSLYVIRLL